MYHILIPFLQIEIVKQLEFLGKGIVKENAVAVFIKIDGTYVTGIVDHTERIKLECGRHALPALDDLVACHPEIHRLDLRFR